MFFNLKTGQEEDTSIGGLVCWRADNNLWFAFGGGEASAYLPDPALEVFCQLLERACLTSEYVQYEADHQHDFYIALEDEDEGTRNLVFMGRGLFFAFNLQTQHLGALAKFLRKAIQ